MILQVPSSKIILGGIPLLNQHLVGKYIIPGSKLLTPPISQGFPLIPSARWNHQITTEPRNPLLHRLEDLDSLPPFRRNRWSHRGKDVGPQKTQGQNFPPSETNQLKGISLQFFSPETATLQIITTYDMFVRGLVIISPLGIGFCEGLVGTCRSLEDVLTVKIRSRNLSIKNTFPVTSSFLKGLVNC